LPVVLPAGSRGAYTFPAKITVQSGESVVSWLESISVGSGAVHEWLVAGPFPADTLAASTLVNTVPDAWKLKAPVTVGNEEFLWRPITNTARLEFTDPVSGSRESGAGWVGAYALCAVEADADLWAEVTVSSGAPGGVVGFAVGAGNLVSQAVAIADEPGPAFPPRRRTRPAHGSRRVHFDS
jgi:hypothetical protein